MEALYIYSIVILMVIIGLFIILNRNADKKIQGQTNFYSLFILGLIVFIPAGIFLLLIGNAAGYGLIGLGVVWAIVGYANKGNWRKEKGIEW